MDHYVTRRCRGTCERERNKLNKVPQNEGAGQVNQLCEIGGKWGNNKDHTRETSSLDCHKLALPLPTLSPLFTPWGFPAAIGFMCKKNQQKIGMLNRNEAISQLFCKADHSFLHGKLVIYGFTFLMAIFWQVTSQSLL